MTTGPFGKNENDLNRVSPFNAGHTDFRRRTRQFQDKQEAQRQRGGGGGGGRFSNIFKPSNEGFDRIRLIPGAYEVEVGNPNGTIDKMVLEYFPFVEHYHSGLEKGGVCSGGPLYFLKLSEDPSKPGRAPCKGCDRFFSDMVVNPETGKKKKGPMSRANKTAFTVLHYHPYHKTESTDRDGKVRKNEETGEPYYDWVPCTGRGCALCKEKAETKQVHRMHWPVPSTHFNLLTGEISNGIGESCANCGNHRSIQAIAWLCEKCQDAVIDMGETQLKNSEIDALVTKECKCPNCGHTGYLQEVIECKKCDNARRASLFDVDFEVKRVATGQNDATILVMGEHEVCDISKDLIELAKPLDLPSIYSPTPMEVQEKIWAGRADDRGGGGRSGSRPLSR